MVEIVQCSNGHKFPVNPKKHTNRDHVICPHPGCHEQVKIRKRLKFLPSSTWSKEKEQRALLRREMHERRKKRGAAPLVVAPGHLESLAAGVLALSKAIQEREKETRNEGLASG